MDSWSVAQQTKMRAGGNTALKRYLAACGMPESYNKNGTTGSIRDKYHTKAAEAYREHIGKIGRGEPTSLVPVPFEVVMQQVVTEKKMAGFGSAPPPREESGLGLGSLVSGISSLTAAAREKASELKDSERARAWKQGIGSGASSLLSAARDAKSRVVEKAQDYASFDAASDLRHLRDGGGDGGDGGDDGFAGFGGFGGFGDVVGDDTAQQAKEAAELAKVKAKEAAGKAKEAASWLWGAAKSNVQEAVSFNPLADLSHLKKGGDGHDDGMFSGFGSDDFGGGGGGGGGGGSSGGGFGGFGSDAAAVDVSDGNASMQSQPTNHARAAPPQPPPAVSSIAAAATASALDEEGGDGWGDDDLGLDDGWGDAPSLSSQSQQQPAVNAKSTDDLDAELDAELDAALGNSDPVPTPTAQEEAAPAPAPAKAGGKPKLAAVKGGGEGWDDDWGDVGW